MSHLYCQVRGVSGTHYSTVDTPPTATFMSASSGDLGFEAGEDAELWYVHASATAASVFTIRQGDGTYIMSASVSASSPMNFCLRGARAVDGFRITTSSAAVTVAVGFNKILR